MRKFSKSCPCGTLAQLNNWRIAPEKLQNADKNGLFARVWLSCAEPRTARRGAIKRCSRGKSACQMRIVRNLHQIYDTPIYQAWQTFRHIFFGEIFLSPQENGLAGNYASYPAISCWIKCIFHLFWRKSVVTIFFLWTAGQCEIQNDADNGKRRGMPSAYKMVAARQRKKRVTTENGGGTPSVLT